MQAKTGAILQVIARLERMKLGALVGFLGILQGDFRCQTLEF